MRLHLPRSGSGPGAGGAAVSSSSSPGPPDQTQGCGREGRGQAGRSPGRWAEGGAVPEGQCGGPRTRGLCRSPHAPAGGGLGRVPSPWPSGVRSAAERKWIPNSLRFQSARKIKFRKFAQGSLTGLGNQGPEHGQTQQAAGRAATERPPQGPRLPRLPPSGGGGSGPVPMWAAGLIARSREQTAAVRHFERSLGRPGCGRGSLVATDGPCLCGHSDRRPTLLWRPVQSRQSQLPGPLP